MMRLTTILCVSLSPLILRNVHSFQQKSFGAGFVRLGSQKIDRQHFGASVTENAAGHFGSRRIYSTTTTTTTTQLKAAENFHHHHNPKETLAFAGKISAFLSNFAITSEKALQINSSLQSVVDPVGMIILGLLGWGVIPLSKAVRQNFFQWKKTPFRDSITYQIAIRISEVSKIGSLVYTVDCLIVILTTLGFRSLPTYHIPKTFAKVMYILWAARRIKIFKSYFLRKDIVTNDRNSDNQNARASVADRIFNIILYLSTFVFCLEVLAMDYGTTFKSIFAMGGVSTLVFSLASKDLAAQIVTGMAMYASNNFGPGDFVCFGDKISGEVVKLGLMATTIKGTDGVNISIPNSEVHKQRISNISRVKTSCVRQSIKFDYADYGKIATVLDEIKEGVKTTCPEAILDGRFPFRAYWTDMDDKYLLAKVDFHFDIPPVGNMYYKNQQKVLKIIADVMRRHGANKFASAP